MEVLLYLLMSIFSSNTDSATISENKTEQIKKEQPKTVNVGNSIVDDLNGLIR